MAASAARWGIVAEDGTAHVEVVGGGEVLRLRVGGGIHDPEVGLGIGANRLRNAAVEGELASIRAEDETTDIHGHGGELGRGSAGGSNRVNVSGGEFVIRLVDALGEEVYA